MKQNIGDNLNERQQEAVSHREGPLLVVAGAGAGKTRVITARIAKLIEDGVRPDTILAVTFTNKAAEEMRSRVRDMIPNSIPFVSTFHSLGVHILKKSGKAIGVSRWFNILDRGDQKSLARKIMKTHDIDPKQFDPSSIINTISRTKGNKFTLGDFENNANGYFEDIVLQVWRDYEKLKDEQNALDFDDLLLKTVLLLENFENVRKLYQDTWKYIHVDEYQDTNNVQYEMIKLLAGDAKNVFVVGDSDQCIYQWRGADYANIKKFEKEFAVDGTTVPVVMLEENYRSTPEILEAANAVIGKNTERKDKKLFTSLPSGELIEIYEAYDGAEEAGYIVSECAHLIQGGVRAEEIAVLYRANFQSRILEEKFLGAGIPYTVLGTRFFERAEIKDILAYAKSALNPSDKISISRILNTPRRGLGDKTTERVLAGKLYELSPATREKVERFFKLLSEIKVKLTSLPPSSALRYIINASGYKEMLKQSGDDGQERLENVQELINLATKYDALPTSEGIEKLIEEASLASDQDVLAREDVKKRGVRLMTVHAAKGLEFEHVFIVGLEQDLFPHRHSDEDLTNKKLEEERRLFYVGLTRAKKKLHLSHASVRQIYGSQLSNIPSEFLESIPGHLVESSIPEARETKTSSWMRKRGYLDDIVEY